MASEDSGLALPELLMAFALPGGAEAAWHLPEGLFTHNRAGTVSMAAER